MCIPIVTIPNHNLRDYLAAWRITASIYDYEETLCDIRLQFPGVVMLPPFIHMQWQETTAVEQLVARPLSPTSKVTGVKSNGGMDWNSGMD